MRRRAEKTQTDGALQLVALKDDGKMGRRLTTGVHLQGDRATTLGMGTRVLMFVERMMDSMCRRWWSKIRKRICGSFGAHRNGHGVVLVLVGAIL